MVKEVQRSRIMVKLRHVPLKDFRKNLIELKRFLLEAGLGQFEVGLRNVGREVVGIGRQFNGPIKIT